MPLTDAQFHAILPHLGQATRDAYLSYLNAAMHEFDISTSLPRLQMFLAQVSEESDGLTAWHEYASGDEYEGRANLGNIYPGDGRRFKGRGPIMCTGRSNYSHYGTVLGIDLLTNPDLAATPKYGFRIAGAYWKEHGCNEIADENTEAAFEHVTRKINGGLRGLEERKAYWKRAKAVLK